MIRRAVGTAGAPRLVPVAAVGAVLALVPGVLGISGALAVQVLAAGAGAAVATAGFALGLRSWPRRRASDLAHLLISLGFFLCCVGVALMLAGVGLWH